MIGAYFDYEGINGEGKWKPFKELQHFWLNEKFLIDKPHRKHRVTRREVVILLRKLLMLPVWLKASENLNENDKLLTRIN